MRWCCALQDALLRLDWPATLLDWAECAPAHDEATGALLWRGLRVRMGMAFGRAEHRKPLNTGAAPAPCATPAQPVHACKHSLMC